LGNEPPAFLKASEALVPLGGGGKAKRETIVAAQEGKRITVNSGYGGSPDGLTAADGPTATFV
jgi:hypothetical protein